MVITENKQNYTLYTVSGERTIKNNIVTFANIGITSRTVKERLKDNDYSRKAAGGGWVIIEEIPIGLITKAEAENIETRIHNNLEDIGFPKNPDNTSNTEEFEFNLTIKEVKNTIKSSVNCIKYGIDRPLNFKPRVPQLVAIEKIIVWCEKLIDKSHKFLLSAIMRFGKTYVTLEAARRVGHKKILIVSGKPDVGNEWREIVIDHVDFVNWNWNDAKKCSKNNPMYVEPNSDKVEVVFLSLQDSKGKDLTSRDIKKKLKQPLSLEYDLLILDEVHFAFNTFKSHKLLDKIKYKRKIEVSGTPFERLLSGEYGPNNSFLYTELNELLDIKNGNITDLLPKMNIITVDIKKELIKELDKFYEEEEGFKWSTLFAYENEKLKNKSELIRMLDILKPQHKREFGGISPWFHSELCDKLEHFIWFLPSNSKAIVAFKKLLQNHPSFQDYEIFAATGDNDGDGKNRDILKKVKLLHKRGKKSIVLSYSKFNTGVTMKMWNTVFMMNDTESPTTYLQSIYRSKSPYPEMNKTNAYAIDFTPNRALVMRYAKAEIEAIVKGEDTSTILKEYNDVLPIMNLEGNNFVKYEHTEIFKSFFKTGSFIKSWTNQSIINITEMTSKLHKFLENLNKIKLDKKTKVTVSDNDVREGKQFKKWERQGKTNKQIRNTFQSDIEKLLGLFQKIPTYLFLMDNEVTGISSFRKTVDEKLFKEVIGISFNKFNKLILNDKIVSDTVVDRLIESFNLTVEENKDDIIEIISQLHFSDTQTKTPHSLVCDMLDKFPKNRFSDPNQTWLDPCCGRGIFLYEIVNRLNEGLKNKIPNDQERIEHIFQNQIYGYDIDKTMIMVTGKVLRNFGYNGKLNIYSKDVLIEEFLMEFNNIIGNPPYQDGKKGGGQNKLYNFFAKKAINEWSKPDGIISFVTPISVGKKSKRFSLTEVDGIKEVDFTSDKHFDVGIKICSWIVDKTHSGKVEVIDSNGNVTNEPNNKPFYDYDTVDREFAEIYNGLRKATDKPIKRMFRQNIAASKTGYNKNKDNTFKYPMYKTDKSKDRNLIISYYSKTIPYYYGKEKLTISLTKGFNDSVIYVGTEDFETNYVVISIGNEDEVRNIKSFIFSDYFIEHTKKWKKLEGYGFNGALKHTPPFDKTKHWTNDEVKEFIEGFKDVN